MDSNKVNFSKILDIIGYSGDKEELSNNFLGLCYSNALVDLAQILPEEKREEVSKAILGTKDEEQAENLKKYFSQEQITDALKKASEKIFEDYYESIKPTLSESKISQLNDYFTTIASSQTA